MKWHVWPTAVVALTMLAPVPLEVACAAKGQPTESSSASPITVRHAEKNGFVTLTHIRQPTDRIGYRFFEHSPMSFGAVPNAPRRPQMGPNPDVLAEQFSGRPGVVVHEREIRGKKHWTDQHWTFYMAPVEDGVELLWVIGTREAGLPDYYGVQQCFRMSGKRNQAWRRRIAEAPSFSEFDLWSAQGEHEPKTSLTCVLRERAWETLPAVPRCVGAQTPLGVNVDRDRFQDKLPTALGPYKAKMLAPIDCGLITRTNREGTWVCALFWERTSHVTDHHPADCLHAIVNIGGVPAWSKRAIRGKIYWFEGTKADLAKRWHGDFLAN